MLDGPKLEMRAFITAGVSQAAAWWFRAAILATAALGLLEARAFPADGDATAGKESVFPGQNWKVAARPGELGWSLEKLDAARRYADSIGTAAVFLVHHGEVVSDWGDTAKRCNVHSIRKSFLSALYGIPGPASRINLDDTMEQLGIDDNEPRLTAAEKQATVRDLLKARSGVYHPALYETESMKKRRPVRGSHAPGTFWYYNNWDFNVLGTIFEQRTGQSIFEAFQQQLARPLEMEDFRLEDGEYVRGGDSIHPAYPFRLTARDMARFGLLFARGGRWRDRQIIPAEWVAETTRSQSSVTTDSGQVRCGYGYLWWTDLDGHQLDGVDLPRDSFTARGHGGHYILVVPSWDLVLVHRVDTEKKDGPSVAGNQFGKLVSLTVEAMPAASRMTPAPGDKSQGATPGGR